MKHESGSMASASGYTTLTLYRRLLMQARPYWRHLGGLFFLSLLSPALKLIAPLPLKLVVDSVLGDHPPPDFVAALLPSDGAGAALLALGAGLLVLIALVGQSVALITSLLSTYTGERLVRGFRAVLFRHAQRLSLSYHDTKGSTDSTYRIQYDAPAIQWILIEGFIPLFMSVLTLVTMTYVIVRIDWHLALAALAVGPALALLSHVFGRRLRGRSKELTKLESSALSVIQEVLAAVRVVKAFGQEDREEERFVAWSAAGVKAKLRIALTAGLLGLLVGLATAAGTAAVLYVGVRDVQQGVLTLGDLLVVMAYLAQLYLPMETLSTKVANLQGSLVCAERAFTLLDQQPDVAEQPGALPLGRSTGAVTLAGVHFAYTPDQPVLRNVTFDIPPGTRVGIEGRTGAGKTTLIGLLMRFYDPAGGQVLLDGVDLRDYRLADLRNQFAVVHQEPVLFSTTIAENIAYARPNATEEEVVAAAKAANAHEFITRLPQGYETRVGERGMQLSGGERQRISLARAFLKDAPVLILDEPTSSVDVKTEALIMEALDRLMDGRTTFMIAHRLSTLEGCDMRLHLDHGRLVAREGENLPPVEVAVERKPVDV
jgi:ATP-binding cassette, subfamily B, bacterial